MEGRAGKVPLAGNTNTGWLKIAAFVFMFIDHAGKVLFNNQHDMRVLGRIAFPVYAWCAIVGFCHTRDVRKYLLRLLAVALVSQPVYVLTLTHNWLRPNICVTLALGVAALWGMREKKWGSEVWAPAAVICLATLLRAEGEWKAVLLMILLYAVRDSRGGIAAVSVSYFLFWGSYSQVTQTILGMPVDLNALPRFAALPLEAVMRGEAWSILALPLLLVRWPERDVRLSKWVGYALYPGHLALILALKALFPGA